MRVENDLNEWFEKKRKEEGLNKQQQAKKIGISESLLSHYANGTREPSKKFLKKVSVHNNFEKLVNKYNTNEQKERIEKDFIDILDNIERIDI